MYDKQHVDKYKQKQLLTNNGHSGTKGKVHNPNFKVHQMVYFKNKAAENRYIVTPQNFIKETDAIGIISKSEFVFRDAKQHAGLNHCQARSVEKLPFHINTSLTMVSLAKAAYHLSIPKEERKAFSLASIKNEYANSFFFDRIISLFNINADSSKIKAIREDIKRWGNITA